MQPRTTPTPYWLWIVYIICDYRTAANSQQTSTPIKMEKCLLWDPNPSPSLPSRTYIFASVATW